MSIRSNLAMRKILVVVVILSFIVGVFFAEPTTLGQEANVLLEMLEHVPDTPDIRGNVVAFTDIAGMFADRVGFDRIESEAEFESLSDEMQSLWSATISGVSYPPRWFEYIFRGMIGEESLGFEFFSILQTLEYGIPPSSANLNVLELDEAIFASTLETYEYTQQEVDGGNLYCPPDGCEGVVGTNLTDRLLLPPIIDDLGRYLPALVLSDTLILSSNFAMIDMHIDVQEGTVSSLGDALEYRVATEAIASLGPIKQALFLPQDADLFSVEMLLEQGLMGGMSEEQIDTIREAYGLNDLDELAESLAPPFELAVLADIDGGDKEITVVGLVYDNEADATLALERVPARLQEYTSLRFRLPIIELLEDRGMEIGVPSVYEGETGLIVRSDTGLFVTLIPLHNPKPPPERVGDDNRIQPSSMGYRLFVQMIVTNDLLWLVTS